MNILLVEDNILNQKVVEYNLQKFNYNVSVVGDGVNALKEVSNKKFDLILMDIMLPDMDGYSITKEIRRMEKEKQSKNPVPIVAITANTLDNDRDKCIKSGMNEYLSKPFTAEQLIEKVNIFMVK